MGRNVGYQNGGLNVIRAPNGNLFFVGGVGVLLLSKNKKEGGKKGRKKNSPRVLDSDGKVQGSDITQKRGKGKAQKLGGE